MQLIPAIDLFGGAVVRLERGEFSTVRRYPFSAEEWLERCAAAGAARLHIVDLEAARTGKPLQASVVRRLLGRGVELQIAGGIRSLEVAQRWLDLGAGRVVVGSAAAERPAEFVEWIGILGAARVVVALDLRRAPDGVRRIATRGWESVSSLSLGETVRLFRGAGLRHALATAIERDGLLQGPDLDLYLELCDSAPEIEWQASGGVREAFDLDDLAATGVRAAIVGRALLEQKLPLTEVMRWSLAVSCPAST